MTAPELVSHLHDLGIELWLDGDKLCYSAPAGVLTSELLGTMAEHKPQIISFLNEAASAVLLPSSLQALSTRPEIVPLSYPQQRLWVFDCVNPGNAVYNMTGLVHYDGELDVPRLQDTINKLVERHESLRTSFSMADGVARQVVSAGIALNFPIIDLRRCPRQEQELEVERLAREEAVKAFDLSQAPLLRVRLVKCGDRDHNLLFTMHHIISDGWSIRVFFQEFEAIYRSLASGQTFALPSLPVQYSDFSIWQREQLDRGFFEGQLAYWKRQFEGEIPVQELPADRPRPVVLTYPGATLSFALSETLVHQARGLCQSENVTLFILLLATCKLLLYRYTGQEDVIVGTTTANRNHAELEGVIGFFANTLPLRTSCSGNPPFLQFLQRVRETVLGAQAHQDIPFEFLLEHLQLKRDPSRNPLFEVMFTFDSGLGQALQLPGLNVTVKPIYSSTAKFDLTFSVLEAPDNVSILLEYNTDLFEDSTIERLTAHFKVLLENAVAIPGRTLSKLPLLSKQEYQQVLYEWNTVASSKRSEICLSQWFERQAARAPEAYAVVDGHKQLIYRDLNVRANQLARYLQRSGVGPESLVGLFLERSIEMVVALLGIIKAGGAYVPLDPAYPKDRLDFIVEDAEIDVILTSGDLVARCPGKTAKLISIDSDWSSISRERTEDLPCKAHPDTLAYVIYTSGSTGRPKGVAVTHRNVARLFEATDAQFAFSSKDVWTFFHSIAFDFSVWEIWGALLYGGKLVIVPFLVSRSPDDFLELLCAEQVTVLNQTPPAFIQLIQTSRFRELHKRLAIRFIVFGGDKLDLRNLKPWLEARGGETQLINMYGITETTVHVTYRRLEQAEITGTSRSLIGKAIADLQLYLLDRNLEPVPIGVPGEMYVGGEGLARGYMNRPDLTAERFIANPYSRVPGARLYKSGDSARYLPSGELEYIGRIDHQVKIRGFRIELGEIQAVIGEHPGVRESLVITDNEKKRILAYVTPSPGETVTVADLRSSLKDKLPEYMVPSTFFVLESFPLTSNGKIDRKALPQHESGRPEQAITYVGPRTDLEKILSHIWSEVLGIDRIGVQDSFFDLGGDSIRVIQVQSKVQQKGFRFNIQEFFRHPTIEQLALRLIASTAAAPSSADNFSLVPAGDRAALPEDVEDAYPLTMLQSGMIFHTSFESISSLYHDVATFYLRCPLDLSNMQAALNELSRRHPVLRTSFALGGFSIPLQLVHRSVDISLEIIDLRHLPESEQAEKIEQWIRAEKARRFELRVPPMIRFCVFQRGEDLFQLTWTEHHAILDGWSVATMMSEFFQIYFGLIGAVKTHVPEPPKTRFRDFVALERAASESPEARQFWTELVSGSVGTVLPSWRRATTDAGTSRKDCIVPLTAEITSAIKQFSKSISTPIKNILLAVHLRVLAFITGNPDVITGLVTNGRPEEADAERVLGLFLNTVPFRFVLKNESWRSLVERVFDLEREILPFRRYPLAEIQRHAKNDHLFETAFNFTYFHVYQNVEQPPGFEVINAVDFVETNFTFQANFTLDVLSASELQLKLAYDPTALSPDQVASIGDYYLRAFDLLCRAPDDICISQSLLSPRERQQVLVGWNETDTDFARAECLHQLFEEQVQRTPEILAVENEAGRLTYAELNRRSNQLARYLRRLGVGPEICVGLCVERSLEMMIGLIGILKTGGAYLPLDPDYPPDRVQYMVGDAAIPVLLTQASLIKRLPQSSATVLSLDSDWNLIARENSEDLNVNVDGRNLIYVIYTSGSTGKPKGAMNTHAAVCNRLLWMQQEYGLNENDRVLQKTPISFDVSVWELFWPLLAGSRLVIAQPGGHKDPSYLGRVIAERKITTIHFVPSMLAAFLHAGAAAACSSLQRIFCSGEALSPQLAAECLNQIPAGLHNLYGPTEAAVDVTYWHCTRANVEEGVPIGQPIANLRLYVLDADLKPAPVGSTGDLYIGGKGLARGYYGKPALTAERFVPDPFHADGGRLYWTGDWARWRFDGKLEFLGRGDDQVKIRGLRIELGEIEVALLEHAQVQDGVVVVKTFAANDRRLVAYITTAGEEVSTDALREHLRRRLPEYMVPSAFVKLEHLPLTPSGKLDRRALPSPEGGHEKTTSYVAPRSSIEKFLAALWGNVLGIENVSIKDNFFELGGHSLSALRIIAQIHSQLGRDLPVSAIFQNPTVERFAECLQENAAVQTSLVAIQPGGPAQPMFCVHPVGGNVFCYFPLSKYLGEEQPLYALQAAGLNAGEVLSSHIEEMAADYIKALREVQPRGPYFLTGWSFGGTVAFEMARQLQAQGEAETVLVMIDSRAPGWSELTADYDEQTLLRGFLADFAAASGKQLFNSPDRFQGLSGEDLFSHVLAQAIANGLLPEGTNQESMLRLFRVYKNNLAVLKTYSPSAYAGKAVLLRAQESNAGDAALGWRPFVQQLEVHRVPGNHYSMMLAPHVKDLAEHLTRYAGRSNVSAVAT